MDFDLVDSRDDGAFGEEVVNSALVEVGDADGFNFFSSQ